MQKNLPAWKVNSGAGMAFDIRNLSRFPKQIEVAPVCLRWTALKYFWLRWEGLGSLIVVTSHEKHRWHILMRKRANKVRKVLVRTRYPRCKGAKCPFTEESCPGENTPESRQIVGWFPAGESLFSKPGARSTVPNQPKNETYCYRLGKHNQTDMHSTFERQILKYG